MAYTFKHGDRPLDDYTIQRAVGSGGFGEVYYALSAGGREVGLKYLRDNPEIELRGVSHTMNLKSPHLINIFDVKKNVHGQYFIIMEYCSGPSLRDLLIAEPNGFGVQKTAFFVREIAKGLAYLHDRGIVHRDLKPGNIFYDDGYVKIGDYGLSKFISVSRHSAQTASVGTVHYMAPEIGSGNYSRGVDIYALGVILYEMLLGKVPFEGSTMGEVLMKHLTAQPAIDELPEPFARIIRKALLKDPKDRYQHVNEMVDELLTVDAVRESLAGFSTKSLEGAVRRGTGDRAPSPIPSPNPYPYQADFNRPQRDAAAPYEGPHGPPPPMPDRLAKRLERISRKVDRRIGRLGGGRSPGGPVVPPGPRNPFAMWRKQDEGKDGGTPPPPAPQIGLLQRIVLTGLLMVALSVGLGLIAWYMHGNEEFGASAGLLVTALWASVMLSRKVIHWCKADTGPRWSQRFLTALCALPLVALASAPILDRDEHIGLPLLFSLTIIAVLNSWWREFECGILGELKFGLAFRAAVGALIVSGIFSAMFNGEPESFLLAAAVAGIVSFALQTTSWWLTGWPAHGHVAPLPPLPGGIPGIPRPDFHRTPAGGNDPHVPRGPEAQYPPASGDFPRPPFAARVEPPFPPPFHRTHPAVNPGSGHPAGPAETSPLRQRWAITRAFWGIFGFLLFGVAICTFFSPFILDLEKETVTLCVLTTLACLLGFVFALLKTTPCKRDGFWRETLRPAIACGAVMAAGTAIVMLSGGRLPQSPEEVIPTETRHEAQDAFLALGRGDFGKMARLLEGGDFKDPDSLKDGEFDEEAEHAAEPSADAHDSDSFSPPAAPAPPTTTAQTRQSEPPTPKFSERWKQHRRDAGAREAERNAKNRDWRTGMSASVEQLVEGGRKRVNRKAASVFILVVSSMVFIAAVSYRGRRRRPIPRPFVNPSESGYPATPGPASNGSQDRPDIAVAGVASNPTNTSQVSGV